MGRRVNKGDCPPIPSPKAQTNFFKKALDDRPFLPILLSAKVAFLLSAPAALIHPKTSGKV